MTALFRRIQPSKKLRITVRSIAQLLKISPNPVSYTHLTLPTIYSV